MQISYEKHDELIELIEDSIEHFCDENMISGELAYTIVECLAHAKIAEIEGRVTPDQTVYWPTTGLHQSAIITE